MSVAAPTCYDQWFPELARIYSLNGAEFIFYPTAIGAEPTDPDIDTQDAWQTIMRGHAIANGVFIGAANRTGVENGVRFYGSSFVCDPMGRVLAQAGRDTTEIITAELDPHIIDTLARPVSAAPPADAGDLWAHTRRIWGKRAAMSIHVTGMTLKKRSCCGLLSDAGRGANTTMLSSRRTRCSTTVDHGVDFIYDVREMSILPPDLITQFKLRYLNKHRNTRQFLVVGVDSYLQLLWNTFTSLPYARHLRALYFDTLDEAREFSQQRHDE